MNRSVIVYGILLTGALVGAYLTWTDEPETQISQGVSIADFETGDLERIEYTAPKKELTVTARSGDGDRYWWVEATRRVEQSNESPDSPHERAAEKSAAGGDTNGPDAGADGSPDAGADGSPDAGMTSETDGDTGTTESGEAAGDGSSDEPTMTTKREVYKASSDFDRFLEDINPLRARRKLPEPDADRRKAYGFEGETKKLVITTGGSSRTFTIGSHTYGRQHVYLRDEKSGNYYVVDVGVIGPFKFSETRLKEQRVMEEGEPELESVTVQSDGRTARLVRHNRDDPSAAYWSFGEDATEKNKTAQSWVDKLLRVQIDRYIEGKRPENLQPRLVVRLNGTDGDTTSVKFFERETGDTTKYFAESDYTKGFVELQRSSASTLISDISTLFEEATGATGK